MPSTTGNPNTPMEKKLPLRDRLAVRQARMVLFFAFVVGLLLSLVQISSDYVSQKDELNGTLNQLSTSIKQAAENAVWFMDIGLATGVVEGLMGYEPILNAKLVNEQDILFEKSRAEHAPKHHPIMLWLFGEEYTKDIVLHPPDEPNEAPIGHLYIQVDPAFVGQAFLQRSLLVAGSGIARTLLLSGFLLVLFYFTLTRPVLTVTRYVRSYAPGHGHPEDLSEKALKPIKGELRLLFDDARTLMKSMENIHGHLEQNVQQRTQELKLSKQSLDSVSAYVMTVGEDLHILYANSALKTWFRDNQIIQKKHNEDTTLEGMSLNTLLGVNDLQFNDNCTTELSCQIAHFHFLLYATPLRLSEHGSLVGYTIEWRDKTEEKHTEQALQEAVEAASEGQLERRLHIPSKNHIYQSIADKFNQLLCANENIINEANQVLSSLAQGDLNHAIKSNFKGAFGILKEHLNHTIQTLNGVILEIQDSAQAVSQSAQDIKHANQTLTGHHKEQGHFLHNTIEDLERLTQTLSESTVYIHQADDLASNAKSEAERGVVATHSVIEAIDLLARSSARVTNITEVINAIAFQTNLLSLNAAVEAARAGAHGKGFSVVASEVQGLSLRCSEAAQEINQLTQESAEKIKECTALVHTSGKTLNDIVQSANQVNSTVVKITQISQQQTEDITRLNAVATELKSTTDSVTALVDEANLASLSISERSQRLNELIRYFQHDKEKINSS